MNMHLYDGVLRDNNILVGTVSSACIAILLLKLATSIFSRGSRAQQYSSLRHIITDNSVEENRSVVVQVI